MENIENAIKEFNTFKFGPECIYRKSEWWDGTGTGRAVLVIWAEYCCRTEDELKKCHINYSDNSCGSNRFNEWLNKYNFTMEWLEAGVLLIYLKPIKKPKTRILKIKSISIPQECVYIIKLYVYNTQTKNIDYDGLWDSDGVNIFTTEWEARDQFGDATFGYSEFIVVDLVKIDFTKNENRETIIAKWEDNIEYYLSDSEDTCGCCIKGWNKPNEFGLCECLCSKCGILLNECKYTCSSYKI
jgi:hypothetical protein